MHLGIWTVSHEEVTRSTNALKHSVTFSALNVDEMKWWRNEVISDFLPQIIILLEVVPDLAPSLQFNPYC